jgi:hypothetical protein
MDHLIIHIPLRCPNGPVSHNKSHDVYKTKRCFISPLYLFSGQPQNLQIWTLYRQLLQIQTTVKSGFFS